MIEINYKSIAPFYDIAASEKEDAKLWKGLIKEIKHQKNQPLIIYELGIGTGRVLEQLLDELTPEDKYIGIDISKELLSILERIFHIRTSSILIVSVEHYFLFLKLFSFFLVATCVSR